MRIDRRVQLGQAGLSARSQGNGHTDHADDVERHDDGRGVDWQAPDPSDWVVVLGAAVRDHRKIKV